MGMHPESSSITLRRDLSQTAQEFDDELAAGGLIADRVAPINKVGEATAGYPIINRENFQTEDDTKRNDDGTYNFIDGKFGKGTYSVDDHGLSTILDDAAKRRYATFLDFENAMTRILQWRIKMARERRTATMVMDTAVYTPNNAATTWATAASADPAADVEAGVLAIKQNSGIPRSMISFICPRTDFNLLCKCAAIIDQVKYTFSGNDGVRPAYLKPKHIAAILELKEVIVPDGAYNSKPEGETASMTSVWGSGKAMLAVLAKGPDTPLEFPAAWRTMLWTEDSPIFPVFERYYSNDRRGEVLRARAQTDEVSTAEANLLTYMIDTLAAS